MTTTNHITKIDFGKNMPSFMKSTLSIAFIMCVVAVIVYLFIGGEPNAMVFGTVSSVIGAYIGSRNPLPSNDTQDVWISNTQKESETSYTARWIGE